MKAVTLGQPHATLVTLGAQTIVTTEHPTGHRGPLAIHAAKRPAGDLEMVELAKLAGLDGIVCPLGAVVATARLVDVVPIIDAKSEWPEADSLVAVYGNDSLGLTQPYRGHDKTTDISDQLPYADFTPGRWAWILDDVKATTDRCPVCMGVARKDLCPKCAHPLGALVKHLLGSTDYYYQYECRKCQHACMYPNRWACPTCDGDGTCPPVPAKGRSGLWEWTP